MIGPKNVHEVLGRHQLADGYPIVMDLAGSKGPWLRDARSGKRFLDLFTCFASWPVGYSHPAMDDAEFLAELTLAAKNNPANSDLYTESMARFVEDFATRVTPEGFDHHFWVAGGSLAVENACKVAFDWKARKLGRTLEDSGNDLSILHLRHAFHGRSGYTMSMTNTDPVKVALFPQFDWPRVYNPAIQFDNKGGIANDIEAEEQRSYQEIEAAFAAHKGTIAAILLEPMQGEGGDNHFRPEYFQALRRYADQHEALLMYDEVQTGFFGSGKPWLWQHKGVAPDVVSFGKKTQVCGIYAGKRIDEVEDNVFAKSSRINSTWGGNLVDMVRARKFIQIILDEKLAENVTEQGARLMGGLRKMSDEKGAFHNVRGTGSLVAFTLETAEQRDKMLKQMMDREVLALASGECAIRFRLPLMIAAADIDTALDRIADCLPAAV